MRWAFIILAICFSPAALRSQASAAEPQKTLKLKKIMADPDWLGRFPESPVWAADGESVYFRRKQKGNEQRDWWTVSAHGGPPRKLSLPELFAELPTGDGDDDANHTRRVFEFDGDLFLRDLASGTVQPLTQTTANESSPKFLQGDQRIQFRRDGKLLVRDLKRGLESELFQLRFEDQPKDAWQRQEEAAKDGFVAKQENELFDYLQDNQRAAEQARKTRNKLDRRNPHDVEEAFYLGAGNEQRSLELAPSGQWASLVIAKKGDRKAGQADNMPVWIRDDGYVQNRQVRSLVGAEEEGSTSLILLDLKSHQQHAIDLSQLPEIASDRLAFLKQSEQEASQTDDTAAQEAPRQKTEATATTSTTSVSVTVVVTGETGSPPDEPTKEVAAAKSQDSPAKPRDVSIRSLAFSRDSRFLLFQAFSTDNKDRWLCSLQLKGKAKPRLRVIQHDYDPAWIHPYRDFNTAQWIGDTHQIAYLSEKSGYSHLWLADAQKGKPQQLTRGHYEVTDPVIARDGSHIFFRSNATHPGVYELSQVDIASGEVSQLSSLGGMNSFELSPDQRQAVALHSSAAEPDHLVLVDLHASSPPRVLADFTSRQFKEIAWAKPHFIEVTSRQGAPIYSRLYLPQGSAADEKTSKRPAVIFVHGAGYLQNSHQGWSGYFREFMFHTLLTQRGYVVLDMDYRASAGYGRDWRTAIYRQMGTPELEDLEDGRKWLIENQQVDPERVGMYGGSYGGFMTLMSLFNSPGTFACGAALRPVTDWAHYNHGYTSNILNEPDEDPEAYLKSSPIYFAEGLSDPLLMCHGMIDDNVFFKDTVRLAQKLIELEKQDWEVAMYPVEAHGFRQPSSWLDEYSRILKLFETHLKENK